MKVVLFQPEIPQNTGNIARTCAVTRTPLILIRPLGFSLSDRYLKRAGLDYWKQLDLQVLDSFEDLCPTGPLYFFSSKAKRRYSDVIFEPSSYLIFGKETSGLPLEFHERFANSFLTIPMAPHIRSLNLSNAVAITLYEALRQQNFPFL